MMLEVWLALIGGLALLIVGGDLLVRGAVRVAERCGVSPLVIGLTLVGFGTSTPEMVRSVQAALTGSPGIAFGNIVGSNIANMMSISSSALRRDAMVKLGVAVAPGSARAPLHGARKRRVKAAGSAAAAYSAWAAFQCSPPCTASPLSRS